MTVGRSLHLVHVSDSHVRDGVERAGDLAALERFVDRVRALHERGVPIDLLVHTGDLADAADAPDATPDVTRAALAVLDALPVPWFLLNGNHDRRAFLEPGPRASGLGDVPATDAAGTAVRDVGDVRLVFADLNPEAGGAGDVDGAVEPRAVRAVADAIDAHAGRSAVFLHYPPLAQEALWPAPPVGGDALHHALVVRAERLHGVFVGHNHRALVHVRDGVTYATAPALAGQFLLWPGQAVHARDDEPVSGLHYVTLEGDGTTRVQHHAFVATRSPEG